MTVEEAGVDRSLLSVHALATHRFGIAPEVARSLSANTWNPAGFGFHTAWIKRGGAPPDLLRAKAWALPSPLPLPELL